MILEKPIILLQQGLSAFVVVAAIVICNVLIVIDWGQEKTNVNQVEAIRSLLID